MSAIKTFDFESSPVRTLVHEEAPWFVARDVCAVLGLKNSRDALSRLDADEKGVALTDTPGGKQHTTTISESGLYTLILRCDDAIKPGTTAHRFRKWVTAEVLPTLRKTGVYELETGRHQVDETISLLRFVREVCAGWSLERQMEFGMTARRYAKSMGVVFQVKNEPNIGRCFAFPRILLDEVRRSYQHTVALPDSDAAEMETLLEKLHIQYGNTSLSPETIRGFAKFLGLFPTIFGPNTSLSSERAAFGKLCVRFDHLPFPSGYVLKVSGQNRQRRLRVERVERPALLA